MRKKTENKTVIDVLEIKMGELDFCLLGTAPLVMNQMAEKARQELLLPAVRKNQAERQAGLKHDPIYEFRAAIHQLQGDEPTRAAMPSRAFSQGLAAAARDIPGAAKAQISRLCEVPGFMVAIYGLPYLYMRVVRQSDINKTPDIRTRAIFPDWAAFVTVKYVRSLITEKTVANLLAAAGVIIGVGDDRRERGGSCGKFILADRENPNFQNLVKNAGRKSQDEMIGKAICYDHETEKLFGWFQAEATNREKQFTKADPDWSPKYDIKTEIASVGGNSHGQRRPTKSGSRSQSGAGSREPAAQRV